MQVGQGKREAPNPTLDITAQSRNRNWDGGREGVRSVTVAVAPDRKNTGKSTQ